ncbi:KDO2-lipid IV(A) lauroyltransferase [Verrucomicrobium sp. GAS474]|uniref:lysophospholipid acyltransferase family protein n=1 Tax=Verrucomicrobium sp. GAS474 TaxID=1882831 RepID=UPI000879CAC6|nr:lysophospholipid acyltransferase family protein [Verrucomicrobium sp. GAS474]SDU05031.1 KDO2-lipid IV(A) lauroyltransferase [Verrucomicrobium sp. GAS474]
MSSHRMEFTYNTGWFRLANTVSRLFPRRLLRPLAALWGLLFAWSHPKKAALLQRNLDLLGATPRPNPTRTYMEFARVMVDYFYAGAHPLPQAIGLVEERLGIEHLRAVHASGRGALLLTPHFSFFELGGLIMRDLGYPMTALTLPEPSPEFTAWRAAYRRRWGVETLVVSADPFQFIEIKKQIEAGQFVAALFDRPHPTQSFAAQLPGGALPCSSGILLLALLAKCPVIPVTVVAKPNGRYRLEAHPPIIVERRGSSAETLRHYTQVLADALLPTLSRHPEQWFQFASLEAVSPAAPTDEATP